MKNLTIIYLLALTLVSCTDFELDDLGMGLKTLPGYVAFANSGGTITPIVRNVSETAAIQNLRIETATGTLSDVTVTYSFSGTAVFGTDFTVTSPGGTANAAGGTILLKKNSKPTGVNDFDFVNLDIDPVTDKVKDGNKTLVITLVSAVNAEGKEFIVGRGAEGGTIYLKEATINMTDVD